MGFIIGGAVILFVVIVSLSISVLANDYDKVTEEQWKDFLKEVEDERTKKNS